MHVQSVSFNSKIFNMIFIVMLLTCSILISFLKEEYSLWIIFFVCLSFIIFLYLRKNIIEESEFKFLLKVCFIGFLIRCLLVVITTLQPSLMIPSDAADYEANGRIIAESFRNGRLPTDIPATAILYYLYNGVIYYLFGFFPSVVRICNSFLGVFAGINAYMIAKRLFGISAAKVSGFLCLFLPSLMFWQSMNLKEAFVVFLLMLIANRLIQIKDKTSVKSLILVMVYIVMLTLVRLYLGIILAGIIGIYFFLTSKMVVEKKILLMLGVAALMGLLTYKIGIGFFGLKYLQAYDLSLIDTVRKVDYQGGSAVLQQVSMNTPMGLLKFISLGALYYLFSPFPWQGNGSIVQFLGVMENMLWYFLFLAFVRGFYSAMKKEKAVVYTLGAILLTIILFYSVSMGNMGLAYRMRGQIIPLFIVFVSLGIVNFGETLDRKLSLIDNEKKLA